MPAQVPDEFLAPPPRKVGDLEAGSEGWVSVYALAVDLDHSLYISVCVETQDTPRPGLVRVWRDAEGRYHVDFEGVERQFEPKDQEVWKRYGLLAPIESISGLGRSAAR